MLLRCLILIIQAVKYLEPQIRLAAKAGKHKKEYKLSLISERTLEKVGNLAEAPIESVFTDPSYGKVHTISVYGKFYDFGGFILLPFSISTHTHTHTHPSLCVFVSGCVGRYVDFTIDFFFSFFNFMLCFKSSLNVERL